jgi:spermidine/putrescine transport system ATP-binding protein
VERPPCLSILGGFIEPTAGTVLIAGCDVTFVPPARRPTVTIFQDYALFPHMKVRDNSPSGWSCGEWRGASGNTLPIRRSRPWVSRYGARRVDELSGGQRQRGDIDVAVGNRVTHQTRIADLVLLHD